ncbi:EAL domain-containing protein [Uliginosibacterium sp. H3]|uniref:EAL domain-containing protein n=1 Tax=Uliginosibacterium silvisoli TaxID=3114758 RepID=A0ABU6K738_9RHOO|nr:EAL domain-containing protein [Uliginosibacterium sp. H3]
METLKVSGETFHITDHASSEFERLFSDPTETAVFSLIDSILVVEDDVMLGESMIALLGTEDREFVYVPSVAEALLELEARSFNLVMLDYRLPDATGLSVMEWLRSRNRPEAVIIISGEDTIEAVVGGLRRGACDYLRKPYHPDQLRHAVDSALRKVELARSNEAMRSRLVQSERLHRYVVESSLDLIFTLTPDGRISYINTRVESLLGMPRHELIGQPYQRLLWEDDHDSGHFAMCERRTGGRSSANIELRLRRGNGMSGVDGFTPGNAFVTIALNSMGMYAGSDGNMPRRFIGTYAVARDISERKRAEEMIAYQAYHDQLTGLPNRTLFKDRLNVSIAQAQRRDSLLGVMFVDLDRFKLVNDSFGHAEGDKLLHGLATRLKRCLRRGDTLARQGGDEFTILLPDLASVDDATTIADKIFKELRPVFQIGGTELRATVSLGISIFPRDGNTADQLIQRADIAMYSVKTHGKNKYSYFQPEMDAAHMQRITLERELQRAIDRDELYLEYQPKYSMQHQRVVGVEALVRWCHPVKGEIPPVEFIPIAEDTSLIHAISDCVIEKACAQLGAWQRGPCQDMRLSLNLSPRDFDRDDIVERVASTARQYGIRAGTLEIEITESSLLHNADSVSQKIRLLRDQGIGVSIDDFGTGFSSLAYLLKLPVNSLKIDRSFVQELGLNCAQHPIVSAIAGVAQGFGLHMVAEGVETEEQVEALSAVGCDEMQGFFFSRPVSAEQITERLRLRAVA